ncbi:AAA family ATPase [Heliophilum fasciatum]|uniref:CO dehydrogenase maturation factor n=1 Tax=Heliophilum fasciatum TaxID=35700 RepID=A0A4R2RPA1_9FIRM|nr:AAA family ATPase [Heliophilum fasciatum]MCW2278107.1 CO dehydrogenase maturation factor [Heliophilum fasciatum]TCP64177.1 CO dehydrogenase maturation factor [Heliophilum fasciatum]
MKIAVVGKGGVGKTTLAAALARTLDHRGYQVVAIDADPDANLASALPLDANERERIVPLAQQGALIDEALGGKEQLRDGLVPLNPDVRPLIEQLSVSWGQGQRLLTLGWTKGGGQGCYCKENALLSRVLSAIPSGSKDVLLIDSEAGLEHMSRGTIRKIDAVIVVLEPGARSVQTARDLHRLAQDLQIPKCLAVLNRCPSPEEREEVQRYLPTWPIVAAFPDDPAIRRADLQGSLPPLSGAFGEGVKQILQQLFPPADNAPVDNAPENKEGSHHA